MLKFFYALTLIICANLVILLFYQKEQLFVPNQCVEENNPNALLNILKQNNNSQRLFGSLVDAVHVNKVTEISYDKKNHIRVCQAEVKLNNNQNKLITYIIEKKLSDVLSFM